MKVTFSFYKVSAVLPKQIKLKKFLIELFNIENKDADSITFIFCSDEYLIGLNQKFLKHDTFTDILTFVLSTDDSPIIGEIYISIERVTENARSYNVEFVKELHRVIFHGALHSCGYNDKTTNQKKFMRLKEEQYLKLYFS